MNPGIPLKETTSSLVCHSMSHSLHLSHRSLQILGRGVARDSEAPERVGARSPAAAANQKAHLRCGSHATGPRLTGNDRRLFGLGGKHIQRVEDT